MPRARALRRNCATASAFWRVALHAQLQRLQALQEQKRVERAERRAEIAQALHARLHDVGEVAEGLVEANAVIALARFEQLREAALVPGKAAAIHDHAADRRAVSADELGGRMHHDVGAVLDGPAEIGRGEGVVDDQRQVVLVRDRGDGGDVEHVHARVADGLAVEHAGARRDGAAEIFGIVGIDEGGLDAEAAEADVELRVGAAVERLGGDDLVAGFEQARRGR